MPRTLGRLTTGRFEMQLQVGNDHPVSEPLGIMLWNCIYQWLVGDEEQSTSCAQLVKQAAGQWGLMDHLMQVSTDRSSVSQPETNCWVCCPQRKAWVRICTAMSRFRWDKSYPEHAPATLSLFFSLTGRVYDNIQCLKVKTRKIKTKMKLSILNVTSIKQSKLARAEVDLPSLKRLQQKWKLFSKLSVPLF